MRSLGILGVALVAAAFGTPVEAKRVYGELVFEPCTLTPGVMPEAVDAQCATFAVPENRAEPDGRRIDLAIAWIPAEAKQPAPDPVFFLAGGPGQGAREAYPGSAGAFAQIVRRRHVILVDQRGTGGSNPLACRDAQGENAFSEGEDLDPASMRAFAQRCRERLDADPAFYTTTDAIADLDAVRVALGAEQVNLIGGSYGTRVAQEYLRRHPEHVRSVVLDGVVPPELILLSEHARNLETSLALQFARCAEDAHCREHLGAPRAHLDALFARLRAAPVQVSLHDPLSNAPVEDTLNAATVAGVVRLFAYSPRIAAMLPLALAEADAGRYALLAAQARMLQTLIGESIMHGMQLSVVCTEDAPFLKADPADANSVLGTALIDLTQAQCAAWPAGTLPADFHQPVVSDKPVLVVSGEFDPVTPPRYGEQVVRNFSNGRHLSLRGQGHTVALAGTGCMPKLLGDFVARADAKGLDVKCLEQLDYTPPFAGYYGWEP